MHIRLDPYQEVKFIRSPMENMGLIIDLRPNPDFMKGQE